jgi:tryptophan-rich sensory protein
MMKSVTRLALCLLICLGVGVLGSLSTRPEIAGWYANLAKPSWTPPPVAFPIAWTTLYILMAIAFWRLWDRAAPSAQRSRAMVLFGVQLALNASWSPVFFGWHGIRSGLAIIVLMVIAIAATIGAAARVDRSAAWLLAPYLLWVLYASTINAGVWLLN